MKYFLLGFLFHAFDSKVRFKLIQESSHKILFTCWARRQTARKTGRSRRHRTSRWSQLEPGRKKAVWAWPWWKPPTAHSVPSTRMRHFLCQGTQKEVFSLISNLTYIVFLLTVSVPTIPWCKLCTRQLDGLHTLLISQPPKRYCHHCHVADETAGFTEVTYLRRQWSWDSKPMTPKPVS